MDHEKSPFGRVTNVNGAGALCGKLLTPKKTTRDVMAKPMCPDCKKTDRVVRETHYENGELIYKWLACNRCDHVFRSIYDRHELLGDTNV